MTPYRTHEVRWFWKGDVPDATRTWFDRLGPAVEGESRTDHYLAPTSDALGVKLREGAGRGQAAHGGGRDADARPRPGDRRGVGQVVVRALGDAGPGRRLGRRRQDAPPAAPRGGGAPCARSSWRCSRSRGETWGVGVLGGPRTERRRPTRGPRRRAPARGSTETTPRPLASDEAMGYPAWLRLRS